MGRSCLPVVKPAKIQFIPAFFTCLAYRSYILDRSPSTILRRLPQSSRLLSTSIRRMAGKRFTTVTKQGRRKDVTNYGTMDSDSLSGAESSGSHQEAGKRTSKRHRCIFYTTIVLFISFGLLWILSSLNNQDETTVGSLLPPMLYHRRPGKDPQYLWVVEHDSNAYNTSLATRRSLYAQDKLTTKTSDGMFRVT